MVSAVASDGGPIIPVRRPTVKSGAPIGVLRSDPGPAPFHLTRYEPGPDLAPWVEHYWIVRWDRCGQAPYRQDTLPHPCVHLVIEAGHSGVFGVVRGRFTKWLAGRGRAAAVRFRPGGFRPFWSAPLHTLTGRVLVPGDAFGADGAALDAAVLACADPAGRSAEELAAVDAVLVGHFEQFLRARRPRPDPQAAFVAGLVDRITGDRTLTSVDAAARAAGTSTRTVQRLFRDYVGVSPKWVVCRQRLHEAAERLADGSPDAWTRFALDLGYYDQAHFIRSFTALVGASPAAYVRQLRRESVPR